MSYYINRIPGRIKREKGYVEYPEDFPHLSAGEVFTAWRVGTDWEIETILKGPELQNRLNEFEQEKAQYALKEAEKYWEIEEELKNKYKANIDVKTIMEHFLAVIFEGEQYGEFCVLTNEDKKAWDAYKALGTVEDCRKAMEKQTAKKPEFVHMVGEITGRFTCECGNSFIHECPSFPHDHMDYCDKCGQKLNWQ